MITRNKQKRMVLNQREQHSKRRTLFLFNTIFSFSDEVHDVEMSRLRHLYNSPSPELLIN